MDTHLRANLGRGGRSTPIGVRASRGALLLALALCLSTRPTLAQAPEDAPDAGASEGDLAAELPATEERIEALQKLASGEHPGVPLSTLLNVSLDDDSSMMERDRAVRLARRKVLIASRVGERFKNRSEEEMARMRDQILAMDLERKVLALPIEVRSRLVDLDAQGGEPEAETGQTTREPGETAPQVEHKKPVGPTKSAVQIEATRGAPKAALSPERASVEELARLKITWRNWLTFFGVLLGTWVVARLAWLGLSRLARRIPARRAQLEQLAAFIALPIHGLGLLTALIIAFPLSPEVMFVLFGTLALALAFATKDLTASVLAGFVVILKRPFQVGDRIAIGDVQGKVTEVGLSATRLLTAQNRVVTMPNNVLLTNMVSAQQPSTAMTPMHLDFFIDPSQDIAAAKRLMDEAIQATRSVETPKGQPILVKQVLTDRGLTVRLRTKIFLMGAQPQEELESELTERVLEAFRTSGIRATQGQAASAAS